MYCGPLKLLAVEVANKSNDRGTPCDLVTGEERKRAREDGEPSEHVSCTVEMTDVTKRYEVAVIDEIQMCKDPQRGWAWTRYTFINATFLQFQTRLPSFQSGIFSMILHVRGECLPDLEFWFFPLEF